MNLGLRTDLKMALSSRIVNMGCAIVGNRSLPRSKAWAFLCRCG